MPECLSSSSAGRGNSCFSREQIDWCEVFSEDLCSGSNFVCCDGIDNNFVPHIHMLVFSLSGFL